MITMASVGVLALAGCGDSGDKASSKASDATSAVKSSASAMTTSASSPTSDAASSSSPTSSASSASQSSSPVSSSMSSSASATGGSAATGGTVHAAKFQKAPPVVGRWKLAKTVAPTSTSAVYNDSGIGANYDVSDSLSESDARARLKTDISNIPGGFCGVGAADYALCFLKTDKGGMVTASATADNPKDNIVVTKEFAQALYAVTK